MINSMDHSAAARGRLYSGGYGPDLAHSVNGLASQNLGNYRGSLQWLANLGQNSAAMQGQSGMGMANQIGSYLQNAGNAQANSYLSNGDNYAHLASQLGQFASSYGNNNNGYTGQGYGSTWGTGNSYGNTPEYNTDVGWVDYGSGP